MFSFGGSGPGLGYFKNPSGLAADSAYNWLVCDEGHNRMQIFTHEGAFITSFGERGNEAGQFDRPCSVCIDAAGRMYVGDHYPRVQVFAFAFSDW